MNDWFTVEKIAENTFVISEYKHWEEAHCYLLCGSDKALLIDTGLGVSDLGIIIKELTALPVMVATTHVHWDHIGGHKYFSNIAVHESETSWINGSFPIPLQVVKNNLTLKPCAFPEGFTLDDYKIYQGKPDRIMHDGDQINLGDRIINVIHTPGHSPGHCCFYESEREDLYSGDLIYKGCLDAFYPSTDPMQFWQSVKKIQQLRVKRVLPGHHAIPVSPDIIDKVADAFHSIHDSGALSQGKGIFDFGEFQIHI